MKGVIRECQVCHRYVAMPDKQCCAKCWRKGLFLDPLIDRLSAAIDAPESKLGKRTTKATAKR